MAPLKGQSKLFRLYASRNRADEILQKLRIERVMSVLKDPAHKARLFEYEASLIQDGVLEPLDLAPKKKSQLKAIKNGDAPDKEPTLSDSDAEADDDKEFCRNTNKYADLKFQVWARAFKQ